MAFSKYNVSGILECVESSKKKKNPPNFIGMAAKCVYFCWYAVCAARVCMSRNSVDIQNNKLLVCGRAKFLAHLCTHTHTPFALVSACKATFHHPFHVLTLSINDVHKRPEGRANPYFPQISHYLIMSIRFVFILSYKQPRRLFQASKFLFHQFQRCFYMCVTPANYNVIYQLNRWGKHCITVTI